MSLQDIFDGIKAILHGVWTMDLHLEYLVLIVMWLYCGHFVYTVGKAIFEEIRDWVMSYARTKVKKTDKNQ